MNLFKTFCCRSASSCSRPALPNPLCPMPGRMDVSKSEGLYLEISGGCRKKEDDYAC